MQNLNKNQELQSLMGRNVSLRSVLLSVIVIVLSSRLERNVLRSTRLLKLHSFLKSCVLDVDSVLRNVLSKQSTLSTYHQDSKVRSLIDMETTSSRSIDFQLQNQEKYSGWLVQTVLVNQVLWRFWVVIWSQILVNGTILQTGLTLSSTLEALNFRHFSRDSSKKI